MALALRKIRTRGGTNSSTARDAAMTSTGTPGVDARVRFGAGVYAMQSKVDEAGPAAGRLGSDPTLTPGDAAEVATQFET